jgi:hypothetical protein
MLIPLHAADPELVVGSAVPSVEAVDSDAADVMYVSPSLVVESIDVGAELLVPGVGIGVLVNRVFVVSDITRGKSKLAKA